MYRVLFGAFLFLAVVGFSLATSQDANAGHGRGCGCHGYTHCCKPCCRPCYQPCCKPCCNPCGCHGVYPASGVPAGGEVPPPPPVNGADSPSDLPPGGDAGAPPITTASYKRAPMAFRTVSFRR